MEIKAVNFYETMVIENTLRVVGCRFSGHVIRSRFNSPHILKILSISFIFVLAHGITS